MIEMFVLTRAARRKMIAEKKSATLVFNRFPRLTDMFELVNKIILFYYPRVTIFPDLKSFIYL